MSRFWLVELQEDLDARGTTRTGVWCGIHQVNGVDSITDMDAITQATLDLILMKPTEVLKQAEPKMYNAIRQYWRRQRQPRLPLDGRN